MDSMVKMKKQSRCLKGGIKGVCSIAGILLTVFLVFSVVGCATFRNVSELYPPIMDQSELKRPYVKIAVLECSSEHIGNLEGVTPQDYDWAHNALRERAYRLGADAVVLPEVRVERDTFLFFPSSQIRAKGIAIKFR